MYNSFKQFLDKFPFLKNILVKFFDKYANNLVRLLPIKKNKICFTSFYGNGYSGYPRLIAQELLSSSKKLKLIWLSNEKPESLPAEIKWYQYGSKLAYFMLATCKVWVDNSRNDIYPPKKNGQRYIQTWHSAGAGLKKAEKDVEASLSKGYIEIAKKDAERTDIMVAECEFQAETHRRAYWYNGEVLPVEFTGLPTQLDKEKAKNEICSFFKIDNNKKILLYAPTFRQQENTDCYLKDYSELLDALSQKFGGNWIVLVKLHPNIVSKADEFSFTKTVINACNFPNIDNLLIASDFYITDYSSPIFNCYRYGINSLIYASDYNEFLSERELFFDIHTLPSPFCEAKDELINSILNYDEVSYRAKSKKLIASLGYYYDYKNLDSIIEYILSNIK